MQGSINIIEKWWWCLASHKNESHWEHTEKDPKLKEGKCRSQNAGGKLRLQSSINVESLISSREWQRETLCPKGNLFFSLDFQETWEWATSNSLAPHQTYNNSWVAKLFQAAIEQHHHSKEQHWLLTWEVKRHCAYHIWWWGVFVKFWRRWTHIQERKPRVATSVNFLVISCFPILGHLPNVTSLFQKGSQWKRGLSLETRELS